MHIQQFCEGLHIFCPNFLTVCPDFKGFFPDFNQIKLFGVRLHPCTPACYTSDLKVYKLFFGKPNAEMSSILSRVESFTE